MKQEKDNKVSSHTPGEWRVISQNTQGYPFAVVCGNPAFDIAIISDKRSNENFAGIEISKANAELIASAPTLKAENEKLKADKAVLLEALNKAKSVIEKYLKNPDTWSATDLHTHDEIEDAIKQINQ